MNIESQLALSVTPQEGAMSVCLLSSAHSANDLANIPQVVDWARPYDWATFGEQLPQRDRCSLNHGLITDGPVAQGIEHTPSKRGVAGSNPAGATNQSGGERSPGNSHRFDDSVFAVMSWGERQLIVDREDAFNVAYFIWSISDQNGKPYAKRWFEGKLVYLHRWLVDAGPGQIVDHINGDTLDCRRSNLRLTDRHGNARNRRGNRNSKSGFKGVRVRGSRFVSVIQGASVGRFPTAVEAARAYDEAARRLYGEFAFCNFPVGAKS